MTYPISISIIKNSKKIEMEIQGNKSIGALQEEFNGYFPFLRIEFYRQRNGDEKNNIEKLNASQKLQLINGSSEKFVINIGKDERVISLKDQFNKFGISVLIFRKAGRVWVETSLTEDWTLDRQNTEGELFSRK